MEIHKDRLEVWYAPIFLLERYSLTFFSFVWFGATILNYYIKILIIAATVICEIRINRKVNAERFDSRFWNIGSFAIFIGIAAVLVWKYKFDHDDFLFKYNFVRMIYLYIKEHELLFSSSTTIAQVCLQEYEFFFIEKMFLYILFGFFGILFLRWVKLYVYKKLKDNISRYNTTMIEYLAQSGSYISMSSFLLFSYFLMKINLNYCVYNVRNMPIVLFLLFILIGITHDCINAYRWRLLINREANPKEEG